MYVDYIKFLLDGAAVGALEHETWELEGATGIIWNILSF